MMSAMGVHQDSQLMSEPTQSSLAGGGEGGPPSKPSFAGELRSPTLMPLFRSDSLRTRTPWEMNGVASGQDGRPTQNRQLGIEGCVVCAISVLRAWQVQSALDKNRTRQQKGLRDRNSPTCTLSQNGYGDN